jgi:hypothetical protein
MSSPTHYLFNFLLTYFLETDLNSGFKLVKQVLYSLSHTCSPFYSDYFVDRISRAIYPGWPQPVILLISASQETGITGLSHQCPVSTCLLISSLYNFLKDLFLDPSHNLVALMHFLSTVSYFLILFFLC